MSEDCEWYGPYCGRQKEKGKKYELWKITGDQQPLKGEAVNERELRNNGRLRWIHYIGHTICVRRVYNVIPYYVQQIISRVNRIRFIDN